MKNVFKKYKLRYLAKNRFVFPEFYGNYWKNCANDLWNGLDSQQRRDIGLTTLSGFEQHIEEVEDDFWNNRFKIYAKWKEATWTRYQRNGWVRLKTGFICKGNMRRNDVLNYPIQGTAFHCLLWSLIKINRYLNDNKMDTKIIGQVHDSVVLDLNPSEEKRLIPIIHKIMCKDIREHWDWITIPLDVEFELTKINESWDKKQEVDFGLYNKI